MLANNPPLAKATFQLLSQLLEHNTFDARLRELMIMRIGWVTGSAYEWTQHWRVATATAGVPPEDVLAVRDWRTSDRLTAADKAVLAATDESLAGKAISDATWAEVRPKYITEDQLQQVEFIVAMGNWTMFSMLLRNLKIPVEDGVAVWPPDGVQLPPQRRHRTMARTIAVGIGIMEYPFDTTDGFWALGRPLRAGRDRFDLANRPDDQPVANSRVHDGVGSDCRPHAAHQIRRQCGVGGDARSRCCWRNNAPRSMCCRKDACCPGLATAVRAGRNGPRCISIRRPAAAPPMRRWRSSTGCGVAKRWTTTGGTSN